MPRTRRAEYRSHRLSCECGAGGRCTSCDRRSCESGLAEDSRRIAADPYRSAGRKRGPARGPRWRKLRRCLPGARGRAEERQAIEVWLVLGSVVVVWSFSSTSALGLGSDREVTSAVGSSVPHLPTQPKGELVSLDRLQCSQLLVVDECGHAMSELGADTATIREVMTLRVIGADESGCCTTRQGQCCGKLCCELIGAVAELSYERPVDLRLKDAPCGARGVAQAQAQPSLQGWYNGIAITQREARTWRGGLGHGFSESVQPNLMEVDRPFRS